jgi:hypothetical protein
MFSLGSGVTAGHGYMIQTVQTNHSRYITLNIEVVLAMYGYVWLCPTNYFRTCTRPRCSELLQQLDDEHADLPMCTAGLMCLVWSHAGTRGHPKEIESEDFTSDFTL